MDCAVDCAMAEFCVIDDERIIILLQDTEFLDFKGFVIFTAQNTFS